MDEPAAVWVCSDRTLNDEYVCTVHPTDDVSIPLDREQAVGYAMTVYGVVARAEYDAAVIASLGGIASVEAAASAVAQLRDRYGTLNFGPTEPMQFHGIVSARDFSPQIHVRLDGRDLTQWTPDEAREHSSYVLEAVHVAELDAVYLHYLTTVVGLDREKALAAVHHLAEFRQVAS